MSSGFIGANILNGNPSYISDLAAQVSTNITNIATTTQLTASNISS